MRASRPFLIGEGERDVGSIDPAARRKVPCDYEGDLPRLVRRLSVHASERPRFGYDADTIRGINAKIPLAGPPTRIGGKSKQLRNAVLGALQTHSVVIALVDARAEEVQELRRDVEDILAQCRERSGVARVAIGLAIQEIEIWMLADPDARNAAFGREVGAKGISEDLEGVRDPKSLWAERAGQTAPHGDIAPALHLDLQRSAAWQSLRPEVVAQACPLGFAPFMAAVLGALPWTRTQST